MTAYEKDIVKAMQKDMRDKGLCGHIFKEEVWANEVMCVLPMPCERHKPTEQPVAWRSRRTPDSNWIYHTTVPEDSMEEILQELMPEGGGVEALFLQPSKELQQDNENLRAKVQFLVDLLETDTHYYGDAEDDPEAPKAFTFPDGDRWWVTGYPRPDIQHE